MPKEIVRQQRLTLKRSASKTQTLARQNHRFNNPPHMISSARLYSPSGNLERSVSYSVQKVNRLNAIAMRVYLDPTIITNKGVNYGIVIHEGMGAGHKQSPIAPQRGTTGRNNLEADPFLYEAYKKELPRLKKNLEQVAIKAAKKVGLS
ncbi:MAG: hypothetical protein U9N61_01645 [Euryarchaeota archaeon]|nr:hypothetical protein [Euryarchaeota archaeon]